MNVKLRSTTFEVVTLANAAYDVYSPTATYTSLTQVQITSERFTTH